MSEPAPGLRSPAPSQRAAERKAWRRQRGAKAYRTGHGAEGWAAAYLMLKGYQILGLRLKTKAGEIDILARRGRTIIVVEVKRRLNRDDALQAVSLNQYNRLLRAGNALLKSKPSLLGHDLRLDLVALAPGRWPHHLKGLVSIREPHDAG